MTHFTAKSFPLLPCRIKTGLGSSSFSPSFSLSRSRHHAFRLLASIPKPDYACDQISTVSTEPTYLDEIIAQGGRPMTARERAMRFPSAAKTLYSDWRRNCHIIDASRTKLNAWTIHHPLRKNKKKRKPDKSSSSNSYGVGDESSDTCQQVSRQHDDVFLIDAGKDEESAPLYIYENEVRPGRIPRRQFEQLRRLRNDLSVVLPLVALYIPPIIGFIPTILAIVAPRQALSHQFHNEFEKVYFPMLEYRQRCAEFPALMEAFWRMTATTNKPKHVKSSNEQDAAGPLIDGLQFHSVFANISGASNIHHLRRGVLSSVEMIPREYLTRFALAVGIHQSFPPPLNRWITALTPSPWLRYRVRQVTQDVSLDDNLLLLEEYHEDGCERLTESEVLHACLMRNLPIDCSMSEMRRCLTNHLKMIEAVKQGLPPSVLQEGFGVFTLHLVILRREFLSTI